ncbi:choice-of-anchor J domain-containing protein [Bacteroidota bacterium]
MHKFLKDLAFIIFLIPALSSNSQDRCGTVLYNQLLEQKHPSRPSEKIFEQWIKEKKRESEIRNRILGRMKIHEEIYIIPVVVHVIHKGESVGEGTNISEAQIISQIEVLNEDFRRQNADTVNTPDMFKSVAVDTGIEFRLALRDPSGNPTNGIVRVRGQKDYWVFTTDDELLKSQSFWPPEDYLNIWVCDMNFLGYSQYPITDLPGAIPPYDRETDGVAISYSAFGSAAKGNFPDLQYNYDRGRTATHEIGHFLSLRHIWGDVSICGPDDYCNDTPIARDHYDACDNIDPYSCDSRDMYENYLDYTFDRCMNIFTTCQKSRMRTVLENSPRRESLLSSSALIPTEGFENDLYARQIVNPPDITCYIDSELAIIVQNIGRNVVNSFKVSYSLNSQTFPDHVVEESLEPAESIQVLLPFVQVPVGDNYILFEVGEPNDTIDANPGNNNLDKVFLVNANEDILPVRNRFDKETLEATGWSVYNPDQSISWNMKEYQLNFEDDYAAAIDLYNYYVIGQEDWLLSPIFNLAGVKELSMFFDYSYASNNSQTDFLDVLVSTNCGTTFPHLVYSARSDDLAITDSESEWMPKIPEDWDRDQVVLTNFAGNNNVRVGIRTTNGNGNVLYLDNIEFFFSEVPNPVIPDNNAITLFPNPTVNSKFNLAINLKEKEDITISVMDINGKIHFYATYPNTLNQTFPFDFSGKRAGMYLIKAVGANFSSIRKLILIP